MTYKNKKSNWKIADFVAHGSNVNCLALSPSNGHMLATGGDDRRVNLWLVGKPNNIMSISGITSPVQSVVFNNSENWIGAGSKSGIVKVFDLEGNRDIRTISGHKAAITSLDFHLYGDILASGSMDTNFKVWDARRKGCLFTYKGHTEAIKDIKFSPDGQWIVSASSDATVKVWNLIAGKMIADFKLHRGPVTTVKFHPRELLMASGSVDKTVKFYDLERLKVVSESVPESNGIRKVLFHETSVGAAAGLLAATQESLKVYGWEPARVYEMVPVHWGKVEDMIISGDQLIAASMAQTNVSVWCIDIKHLRPFSGDTSTFSGEAIPSSLSASGRRHFEYEKQEISSPSYPQFSGDVAAQNGEEKREGEGKAGDSITEGTGLSSEEGNEEENSPPIHIQDKDRREIFAARQKMIHTPPKKSKTPFSRLLPTTNSLGRGRNYFNPPVSYQHNPSPPSSPHSQRNRTQHVTHPNAVPSSDKAAGTQPQDFPQSIQVIERKNERRLYHLDNLIQPHLQQQRQQPVLSAHSLPELHQPLPLHKPSVQPISYQQGSESISDPRLSHNEVQPPPLPPLPRELVIEDKSRDMLQDFVPLKPKINVPAAMGGHISVSRAASEILTSMEDHVDVIQILESRLHTLKEVRAGWSINNPRISVGLAVDSNNVSVLVDLLNVLHLKRTLWTLDLAIMILPELKALICSRYKVYVGCGCNVIKLILKSFGPVIKSNLLSPPSGGRDLHRDERFERCQLCHAHLKALREEVSRIVRESPGSPVGKLIRERAVLTAFNSLD